MTKKDYELIGSIIGDINFFVCSPNTNQNKMIKAFIEKLSAKDPKFNPVKFKQNMFKPNNLTEEEYLKIRDLSRIF